MNETESAHLIPRHHRAADLARAIEADPIGLAGALLETLDRLDALVSVKDVASGRYVLANRPMCELFGRPLGGLEAATDLELMEAPQAGAIRSAEQAALAHATVMLSEHRVERDGRKREFSVTRLALQRSDGQPAHHVLGVWVERTRTVQLEVQLRN